VGTAARAGALYAHKLCAYAGGPDSPDSPEGAAQVLQRAKQELPATMLSMDYTRVWYTDK